MSNKNNNSDSFFSNQDTIVRRAWINSALEGVRSRLASGLDTGGVAGSTEGADVASGEGASAPAAPRQPAAADGAAQRGLYVAWSSPERRSGT